MAPQPEASLSRELCDAAVRSDNEWGWAPELIPRVIDEAEELGLLSVGGQLQCLTPGGTCECYWVSVDTPLDEPDGLDWGSRVTFAAEASRRQFAAIRETFDFIAEGRRAFEPYLSPYEAAGGDLKQIMCFIWYLQADDEA